MSTLRMPGGRRDLITLALSVAPVAKGVLASTIADNSGKVIHIQGVRGAKGI